MFEGAVGRPRLDESNWLKDCCCEADCAGERVAELDETDELRLRVRRLAEDCARGLFETSGGNALREGLCDDELGLSGA